MPSQGEQLTVEILSGVTSGWMMFLQGGSGKDVLKGGAGNDTLYGLAGDDSLVGAGGDDVLAGHSGNDTLSGGVGDDYMLGGVGNDVLDGGAGNDWSAYEDATSAVKVDLNLAAWQNTGGGGTDKLTGIENLYGSAFGDTLIGNAGANYVFGGGGDDLVMGGLGDDQLSGGAGNDLIDGGPGIDTVNYDDGLPGGVLVNLEQGLAFWHGADTLTSIECVYGSSGNDDITGDAQDNWLGGAGGADMLNGGGGADVLDGGAGDDYFVINTTPGEEIILGGDGLDTAYFNSAPFDYQTTYFPGVQVDLAQGGPQQVDASRSVMLSSVENFRGSFGNDTVFASTETNRLDGSAGSDRYVFRSISELGSGDNADYILLKPYLDTIDLSQIDADINQAGDQAFHVMWTPENPTAGFTGHAGEIIQTFDVNTSQGSCRLDFDVNGDGVADASLWLAYAPVPGTFIL